MPSRRARTGLVSSFLSLAVASPCALCAAPALADPEPVQLAWVRGPGADACSSGQQIALLVGGRFAQNPFAPDAARIIEAYVTRSESGWRAQINVRERSGELSGSRELTSVAPDCASIESAAVLAIALAIDPEGNTLHPPVPRVLDTHPAEPPPPLPRPVASPPPATPPAPAPRPPPAADRPSKVLLGPSGAAFGAAADLGLLPQTGAAALFAAQVAVSHRAQITGEGLWMPERRTTDGRFGFGLSAFGLGGCFRVVPGSVADLGACGSLWGGALHAVVYQLMPTQPGDRAWVATALTSRLRLAFGAHVHAELGVHFFVPLLRQPFTVTGESATVFQEPPVAVLPFAAIGAQLP